MVAPVDDTPTLAIVTGITVAVMDIMAGGAVLAITLLGSLLAAAITVAVVHGCIAML
jgi:hypothetical protein